MRARRALIAITFVAFAPPFVGDAPSAGAADPCPETVHGDPRGDASPLDVEWLSLTYRCDRGVYQLQYLEVGTSAHDVEAIEVWFEADDNPRNGCEGFDYVLRYSPPAAVIHDVAQCAEPWPESGRATVESDPHGTPMLLWAPGAIGNTRLDFRVRTTVTGPGGAADVVPNTGTVVIRGPDGLRPPPTPPSPTTWNGRCEIPMASGAARDAIVRLYYAYFHRDALEDPAGLEYWHDKHWSGELCLTEVSEYFARSAEFVGTYGMLDDRQFVQRVYLNVLDREPDANGYDYWVRQLGSGMRRGTMMVGFSESPEFRSRSGLP